MTSITLVLALDNGDTFHGTMAAVRTHGEALMAPMSALGLDAMTVPGSSPMA